MQLAELEEEYDKARETAQSDYYWYWKNRLVYIALSWLLRGGAALAVAAGVLFPVLHPAGDVDFRWFKASSGAQAAIAFLLIAGLLVGLNQVFLVTSSWSRYALAMLRIRTLLRLFEWDWKTLKEGFAGEVDAEGTRKALELFKGLVAESSKIVEAESTTWSTDLTKAVESLATLIKEQRGVAEAQVKEIQKLQDDARKEAAQARTEQEKIAEAARKAGTPGAVRLKFEGAVARLNGQVKASLAGIEQVSDAKALSFAFSSVEPGIKELVVSFQDASANAVTLRSVVEVASGKITEAAVVVPGT